MSTDWTRDSVRASRLPFVVTSIAALLWRLRDWATASAAAAAVAVCCAFSLTFSPTWGVLVRGVIAARSAAICVIAKLLVVDAAAATAAAVSVGNGAGNGAVAGGCGGGGGGGGGEPSGEEEGVIAINTVAVGLEGLREEGGDPANNPGAVASSATKSPPSSPLFKLPNRFLDGEACRLSEAAAVAISNAASSAAPSGAAIEDG